MGISVGVMRGLGDLVAINENLSVRQRWCFQFLGRWGKGAHSSCYLIIIASFFKVWSFQLLKAMLA